MENISEAGEKFQEVQVSAGATVEVMTGHVLLFSS
jgi:hypothetical protein